VFLIFAESVQNEILWLLLVHTERWQNYVMVILCCFAYSGHRFVGQGDT